MAGPFPAQRALLTAPAPAPALVVAVLMALVSVAGAEKSPPPPPIVRSWDVAVVIQDHIELLDSGGSLLGVTSQRFNKLKSVTFDEVRQEMIVGDMEGDNDTIYKVGLHEKSLATPIVSDIPDDVKGVAIDTVSDVLYWTDKLHRKISWISLHDAGDDAKGEILFESKDQTPQGLVVDSCRRKLYWTNSNYPFASIQQSDLNGTDQKTIVSKDLFMPAGITIDQNEKRLYWVDMGQGIYFHIESANLDGSDRKTVYRDTHQHPYGIAVDKDFIYWTDLTNQALWALQKNATDIKPIKLREFSIRPMGVVARNIEYDSSECINVLEIKINKTGEDFYEVRDSAECEMNLCHNYCYNGTCQLSLDGFPQCRCLNGYTGTRCEYSVCQNFCLNGATCKPILNNTIWIGKCDCQPGYFGNRCEHKDDDTICKIFCLEGRNVLYNNKDNLECSCNEEIHKQNETLSLSFKTNLEEKLKDPLVFGFIFATFILLLVILAMSISLCRLRRRPRIKKRIIVNKNITPLTYRPSQPTEQCEITIENCCNMNICETPCFEPPQLRGFQRSKKDEKKTLLTSMENGEDLY